MVKLTKAGVNMQIAKKHWPTLITLIIANMMDTGIALFFPLLVKLIIDVSFYNRDMNLFIQIITGIVILFVCRLILYFIIDLSWIYLNMHFKYFVAQKVYSKILHMKPLHFIKIPIGDMIERINHDTDHFWSIFYWSGIYLIIPVIFVVSTIIILFFIDVLVASILITVSLTSVIISYVLSENIRKIHKSFVDKNAAYLGWLYEILQGIKQILLLASQKFILTQFIKKNIELIRIKTKTSRNEFIFNRSSNAMFYFSNILIYLICAIRILNGHFLIGSFVAIIQFASILNTNFSVLLNYILSYKKSDVCVERVLDVLNNDTDYQDDGTIPFPQTVHTICFRNVSFQYVEENKVLTNFNLTLTVGGKYAIVAKSGMGKSTLLDLLMRFYDPCSGDIFINDINIKDISLSSLRKGVGIIFQEPFLYHDTVRYNIADQKNLYDDEHLLTKLHLADIGEVVDNLPNRLDSRIGVDGLLLSRGQMQRITIARLLNQDPQVILMDEATASLDKESENKIFDIINQESLKKIVVVVTHRYATMEKCDKILVMNHGAVTVLSSLTELKEVYADISTMSKDQEEIIC